MGLVLAIVSATLLLFVGLIFRAAVRRAEFFASYAKRAAADGEAILVSPRRAVFRRGSSVFGAGPGNGVGVISDRRIVFRRNGGGVAQIPLAALRGYRDVTELDGAPVKDVLVLETTEDGELVFATPHKEEWLATFAKVVGPHVA